MRTEFTFDENDYLIASQIHQCGLYICLYKNNQMLFQESFDITLFSKSWQTRYKIKTNEQLEKELHKDIKKRVLTGKEK